MNADDFVSTSPDGACGTSGDSGTLMQGEPNAGAPASRVLQVDWALYEHHLAEADLSDDAKREFLEALWYIVSTFVDLGFGIEPVQQAMRAAGAKPSNGDTPRTGDHALAGDFDVATNQTQRRGGKGPGP